MSENISLLSQQAYYLPLMNDTIQVSAYSGRDNTGARVIDNSTTRQYKCLIQINEDTRWSNTGAIDALPYVAYVLSTPIGQTEPVPIRVEEQITIVAPSYLASATPRRLGTVKSYPDQYGNLFCYMITFQ